jgi:hypothetical protein
MARIRTIKPEFFTSEDIVELSPLARLLYIATWCEADKEGRLVWKPRTFKLRYFPGDDCNIEALCAEVLEAGLVVVYGMHAYIPRFTSHQHLNPRESESILPPPPPPPAHVEQSPKSTRESRVPDASPRVATREPRDIDAQGGREGKGREGKGREREIQRVHARPPKPESVTQQTWDDWIEHRRSKKASVTSTVIESAALEASKAGMSLDAFLREWCTRGTQGLKAEWITKHNGSHAPETPWQRSQRERVHEMTGGLVSRKPPTANQPEIIDAPAAPARLG